MYHHVAPVVPPGLYARALTLTPDEFRRQLAWLRARGCRVVSVDTLYRDSQRGALAPCEAALTFDDGYDDVAKFAAPLLRHFGDVATLYISTGLVGTPGHVTIGELRSLHAAGMEIGAHTVHHVDLTIVPQAKAAREIQSSLSSLRDWLAAPVTSFAYPAGRFNPSVVAHVAAAHVENAVTTLPGYINAAPSRYELPRYRIRRGSGTRVLQDVFGRSPAAPAWAELAHIARERIEGNAPGMAEDVAVALLARSFPEQILKVHVLALPPATVAGIMLSGVKFHHAVNREQFEADVSDMVEAAFDAAPRVDEVDVWTIVPIQVAAGTIVSGDYAEPTSRTVFSAAVTRAKFDASGRLDLGTTFWDPQFLP